MTFLPAFAKHMRMLKTEDDEALVLFETGSPSPSTATSAGPSTADYCELDSRFGAVTVGLAGEDRPVNAGSGFWKMIGGYLFGGDS
jgi:hypothetical protein